MTEGSPIWLSQTSGDFTTTRPSAPSMSVFLGYIIYAHSTEGIIAVRPQVIPRLQGLSDVLGSTNTTGQFAVWDNDSKTFKFNYNLINIQNNITNNLTYLYGNITRINNNLTYVYSNITNINNNLTYVYGNITRINNNLTYIYGNISASGTNWTNVSNNFYKVNQTVGQKIIGGNINLETSGATININDTSGLQYSFGDVNGIHGMIIQDPKNKNRMPTGLQYDYTSGLIDWSINVPQLGGLGEDTSKIGGLMRWDTRPGSADTNGFLLLSYPSTTAHGSYLHLLHIDGDTGLTQIAPTQGNVVLGKWDDDGVSKLQVKGSAAFSTDGTGSTPYAHTLTLKRPDPTSVTGTYQGYIFNSNNADQWFFGQREYSADANQDFTVFSWTAPNGGNVAQFGRTTGNTNLGGYTGGTVAKLMVADGTSSGGNTETIGDVPYFSVSQSWNGGYLNAYGYYYEFRVYAYKTVEGTRIYSTNAATWTGNDDSSYNSFDWYLTWGGVSGAEGYKIVVYDGYNGYYNNYYVETGSTDYWYMGYNSNPYYEDPIVVSPNSYTYPSVTGKSAYFDGEVDVKSKIGVGTTSPERGFHQYYATDGSGADGKFTVESTSGSYGQFQVVNPADGEVTFVLGANSVTNADGTITNNNGDGSKIWAFGLGPYSQPSNWWTFGNNEVGGPVMQVTNRGTLKVNYQDGTGPTVAMNNVNSGGVVAFDFQNAGGLVSNMAYIGDIEAGSGKAFFGANVNPGNIPFVAGGTCVWLGYDYTSGMPTDQTDCTFTSNSEGSMNLASGDYYISGATIPVSHWNNDAGYVTSSFNPFNQVLNKTSNVSFNNINITRNTTDSSIPFRITGVGNYGGSPTNYTDGVGISLIYNAIGNRQFWIGDTASGYGLRINQNQLSGWNYATKTDQSLTLGVNGVDVSVNSGGGTTYFGGNITLLDTVWDDVPAPLLAGGKPSTNPYKVGTFMGTVEQAYFSDAALNSEENADLTIQIPHKVKLGSNISFHCHGSPNSNNGTNQNVTFNIAYTCANITGTYPTLTSLTKSFNLTSTGGLGSNYTHNILDFGVLNNCNAGISEIIALRLHRNSSLSSDTFNQNYFMLSCDAHIEINRLGSDLETSG